jgi:hypothetical protein
VTAVEGVMKGQTIWLIWIDGEYFFTFRMIILIGTNLGQTRVS